MKDANGEGEEEEEEIVEMIEDDGEDEDEDFDGVLLNLTPSFNTLSVVLRDEVCDEVRQVLAATAGGSRWDVIGEYEIGAIEEEEEEEEETPNLAVHSFSIAALTIYRPFSIREMAIRNLFVPLRLSVCPPSQNSDVLSVSLKWQSVETDPEMVRRDAWRLVRKKSSA